MTSSVEQSGAPLPDLTQQPGSLAAAVAAGELWIEAGVAEKAAQRCDQAVDVINDLLTGVRELIRKREFGANDDGRSAAKRFSDAGQDYADTMKNAGYVFANMAATYRAAGRRVAEDDAASEQMFRVWSE